MAKTPDHLLEYQKEYRKQNRQWITKKQKQKRQARVLEGIALLGGCCSSCKQSFPPYVYDFHHIDPTKKELTISENMLISKERFQIEISKCVLLCANCHRIEHNKDYDATN